MGFKEWWKKTISGTKQSKSLKNSDPPETLEPKKDVSWKTKEWRQATLILGEMNDSKRGVYVYLDYSMDVIETLLKDNPNWFQEEVASYPLIYTEGGLVQYKNKPYYLIRPTMPEEEV